MGASCFSTISTFFFKLAKYNAKESCGKCTPCRVGTAKAAVLMQGTDWNIPLLEDLSQVMTDASICGLGQAAANPVKSVIKYFPEEIKNGSKS